MTYWDMVAFCNICIAKANIAIYGDLLYTDISCSLRRDHTVNLCTFVCVNECVSLCVCSQLDDYLCSQLLVCAVFH